MASIGMMLSPVATILLAICQVTERWHWNCHKKWHDKAFEAYNAAYAKHTCDCAKLLDWIKPNSKMKEKAKQDFMNTDYMNKLYGQTHLGHPIKAPEEPQFSALSTQRAETRRVAF